MSYGRNFDYPMSHEGRMAINTLHQIEQDARTLRINLQADDDLPTWVQYKIYTAADRLGSASKYMVNKMKAQGYPIKSNPAELDAYGNSPGSILLMGLAGYALYKVITK
jgi:hypothetical protein